MAERRRTGRRPGQSGTRAAIAEAARRRFAELGYERTTIRAIARDAAVDPALVARFFGSKQKLFVSVMTLPFEPEVAFPEVLAGPRSQAGLRLARFAVGVLEDPQGRSVITGLLRAAASEPEAARMVRDLIARRVVAAISETLAVDDARLRANLVASLIVGLAMSRYIVRAEPLASLPPDAVVEAIAPNLQRYLTQPLGSRATASGAARGGRRAAGG
jgi:AcrR family transcriptional regulator